MSTEGANFTLSGTDVEVEFDNVPTDQDIVKKLDMEFATPFQMPSQTGKAVNFDPKKDHMRVFLRIRPFSDDETNKGENQKCIDAVNEHTIIAHAPKDSHTYKNSVHGNTKASNKFTFSKIFREDTTQKEFFDTAMLGTVKDFVDGQNCLVFTYGVTNSGKTYTIQGVPHDGGILPRALDVLFNSISGKQMDDMSLKPKMFCDVVRLSPEEMDKEVQVKEHTLKMATSEEPDVNTLVGSSDTSDISALTINSTTNVGSISNLSEDSLMTSRFSTASTTSTTKASIDSLSKDTLETLMEEAEGRVREEGTIDVDFQGQVKFGVWVSFAEIYNEQIFDLLEPPPKKKKGKRSILHLREDRNGVPYIKGLREICVKSADEAYQILNIGKKNLQFACTKLNHNSSRSHCIFTVKLLRVVDKDMPNMARMSMLSLCDLAGSERYSKTQGLGDRIKEASNINTSLLTLGRCIKTLRHNQLNKEQQRIVPFRDSKLTRVFQSFFCGKGRASMVVNINQLASLFDETLHALKYSAIAKEVIVTQEEEEKKPPPKKRGMVSMAFKQMHRDRTTIGWATPGTIAKIIEEEEAGCNLPLPEDDDEDLEEPGQQTDRTQVANLVEVVEHLKEELINARKQKMAMEMTIREEVCREMAQQLVEIESQYSERVKEAQYLAEEKAEKKIELLTMSMKKTKKRKRIMDPDDDDDEYVSSLLLHQEQVKVQERDLKIVSLKKEISTLEKTVKDYAEEKEGLMEKVSKLEFKNTHLSEKLQEFNAMVEEQAQLFKENNEQMLQLEQRIGERDARIAELEQMVQSKACPSCQESTNQMGELISKLADMEQQLDQKEEAIIKMEQMSDLVTCDLSDKVATIEELEYKLTELRADKADQEARAGKKIEGNTSAKLRQELENLKSELNSKYREITELKSNNEENEAKFTEVLNEKNGKIQELQEVVGETETKLKQAMAELKSTTEEVSMLKERVSKLETDVQDLNSDLDEAHVIVEAKTNEINLMRTAADLKEAMTERLNCLEEELQHSREAARSQEKASVREIASLKENLTELEARLQTKEMDLTKCETDIFEALEKVSEGDQEYKKLKELLSEQEKDIEELKESLKQAERAKCEQVADTDALRKRLASLEQEIEERDGEEKEKDCLAKQVEELKDLVDQKEKALSRARQELGGLRDSLDSESGNVTTLEASLHQANEVVRCKALEVTEVENKLEAAQTENRELKETIESLRSHNKEEQSELNEKYSAESDKVKVLGKKVSDLECELGMLKSAAEACSSSEREPESEMVGERPGGERQQQLEEEMQSLQQRLDEKEQAVVRLCADGEKLKRCMDAERKETRAAKNQLHQAECLFENIERELKQEKCQREQNKAEISKLELSIQELENKLKDAEASLTESRASVQDLERKVAGLQASLDVVGQVEEDLQEMSANLEQVMGERDRLQAKLTDMEAEMAQLREAGHPEGAGEDSEEELRQRVRQLEGKVQDAEYKHQMSHRQMRREKAQLEKLLRERDAVLSTSEERARELEERLTTVQTSEREAYTRKVEQHSKRAQKLQDVVSDLEHCLRSSKDSEERVEKVAEEYRCKYRELEKQYAVVEDQLKELYDKRDSIASEKDHNEIRFSTVLYEKQKDMEDLRATISDLREEILTLQDIINRNATEHGRQMYEKNDLIASLESDLKALNRDSVCSDTRSDSRITQLEAELTERQVELEVKVNRVAILQSDLKEKDSEVRLGEQKIDSLEAELEKRRTEGEVCANRLECVEQELESKLQEAEDTGRKLKQMEKDLANRNTEVTKDQQKIDSMEAESQASRKMIDTLEAELKEKKQMIDSLETEFTEHKKVTESLEVEFTEKKNFINSLEVVLQEKNTMIDSLEAELAKTKESSEEVKKQLDVINMGDQEKTEELSNLREKYTKETAEIQAEVAELKSSVQQKEEIIEELHSQCETIKKCIDNDNVSGSTLVEKVESLVKELHDKTSQIEKLAASEKTSEEKLVSLEARCCTLQEELQSLRVERDALQERGRESAGRERLDSELESTKCEVEELRATKQQLEREATNREKSIESYNKRIGLLKEESLQLTQQLEKSQEGESKLRGQMRERSAQMEEQATQFVQLQESLKQREEEREQHVARIEELERKLQESKSEVDSLQASVQSGSDQCQEVRRAGQQEVDALRLEVKQLQLDLEVKDKRLEKKNKKISDLLQEGCEQGMKYEIAFHDVQANEKLIEQLKKALEEQEQVMEMQDTHTKKKEEEYAQLLKELETVSEKYNALLKESAENTSHLRQTEHVQRRAETEKLEQRRQIEELQAEVTMLRSRLSSLEGAQHAAHVDRAVLSDLEAQLVRTKTQHEGTKQELIRSERERLRLEADVKGGQTDVRGMEDQLEQARREREQMRRELERSQEKEVEAGRARDKLQEQCTQSEATRGQAQLLKLKFQSLEEQKSQLEKELDLLKDQIKTSDEKKELELQKWRQDRDKLVSQLQDILTKKDAEIKVLKEGGTQPPADILGEEVASLQTQLGDKDAIIAELSSHLEKNAPKTRRGRHKKGTSTAGSDEEMDSLKKELASLHQQLESERQSYVKQSDTQMRAKDEIISDLKEANETLQSHLKRLRVAPSNDPLHMAGGSGLAPHPLDVEEESLGIQCDLEGTPTLSSVHSGTSVTSSGKPAKQRGSKKTRGRPKKRKSSETEDTQSVCSEDLSEPHSSSSLPRGGAKRSSTRHPRGSKKSFRLDENEEPSMGVIREEDVVDLSMLETSRGGAGRVLNNSTNLLDLPDHGKLLNSTPKAGDHRQPTFVSPCTEGKAPPSVVKKKKRLHKTQIDEPFAASPNDPSEADNQPAKSDAHQIVKRKLRSRKH